MLLKWMAQKNRIGKFAKQNGKDFIIAINTELSLILKQTKLVNLLKSKNLYMI